MHIVIHLYHKLVLAIPSQAFSFIELGFCLFPGKVCQVEANFILIEF